MASAGCARDALARHAGAELRLDLVHGALGALEAEGAPQLLGLAAGEARRRHRHPQELLLEERDAERAGQDGLERRMGHGHRLAPRAAAEIGMHHVADDGPRPDDGHLHHEVVEALGPEARERRHLGAALHLEDADGVGLLEHGVHLRIVGRQMREIHMAAALARIISSASWSSAIMPSPRRSTLTMPSAAQSSLSHWTTDAAGHGGGLERHDAVEPALADHHAARVLAEMARQILDGRPHAGRSAGCARSLGSQPASREMRGERRRRDRGTPSRSRARPAAR